MGGLLPDMNPALLGLADLCIVVASNNDECLGRNLLASPLVQMGVQIHIERGAPSASVAYNRGLAATSAPIVIFAHQDVYFPQGWEARLFAAIAALQAQGANWALLGPFGMAQVFDTDQATSPPSSAVQKSKALHLGDVWSTSLGRRVGLPVATPCLVQSFDELAIVMRRDAGLRFDEALPLWHLYGTDIVQIARAAGYGAYVIDAPVVHNDGFHGKLGADFTAAYHFIRQKWRDQLPLRSPVLWITRSGFALPLYRFRAWRSFERRRAMAADMQADPRIYADQSGWANGL